MLPMMANQRSEGEGDQKLTNQFSYVERATQTMNNTLKVMILMMHIIYVVDDVIVLNTMGNVIPCLPFIPQFIFFVPHGDGHS